MKPGLTLHADDPSLFAFQASGQVTGDNTLMVTLDDNQIDGNSTWMTTDLSQHGRHSRRRRRVRR